MKKEADGLFYAGGAATDSTNRIQYTAHGAMSVMKLGRRNRGQAFDSAILPLMLNRQTGVTNPAEFIPTSMVALSPGNETAPEFLM